MVEEELDETAYWLELIMELELVKPELLQDLHCLLYTSPSPRD